MTEEGMKFLVSVLLLIGAFGIVVAVAYLVLPFIQRKGWL